MISTAKQIQVFIHRHYDNIKLLLLLVIMGLVVVEIISGNIFSAQTTQNLDRSTKTLLQNMERENKEQTEVINKQTEQLNTQLQALCIVIIQTSGENVLKQVDPPLEESCRNLSKEVKSEKRTVSRLPAGVSSNAVPQSKPKTSTQVRPQAQPPAVMPERTQVAKPKPESEEEPGRKGLIPGTLYLVQEQLKVLGL